MSVIMRNISSHIQSVTIVRPDRSYQRQVYPLNYLLLTEEEYADINPPLSMSAWEITLKPPEPAPQPTPGPNPAIPPAVTAAINDLQERIRRLTEKLDSDLGISQTDYRNKIADGL